MREARLRLEFVFESNRGPEKKQHGGTESRVSRWSPRALRARPTPGIACHTEELSLFSPCVPVCLRASVLKLFP